MSNKPFSIALADIVAGLKRYPLVAVLGWQDLRQRYRRSTLGPFWITIGMAVMIGTIGLVFGQLFKAPLDEFFPFLAIGTIIWSFISSVILEGSTGFITAESIIKQLPLPLFVHIMRMIWRNLLIMAHNIVIFPLVLLAVSKPVGWTALLAIPGLALTVVNLSWIALLLALLCARYRDLPNIINSIMQVVFYVTPIMWLPKLLPARAGVYLLDGNPFFHMLEVIRAPLLGAMPSTANWVISLGIAVVGWTLALVVYGRYKRRIAYWL